MFPAAHTTRIPGNLCTQTHTKVKKQTHVKCIVILNILRLSKVSAKYDIMSRISSTSQGCVFDAFGAPLWILFTKWQINRECHSLSLTPTHASQHQSSCTSGSYHIIHLHGPTAWSSQTWTRCRASSTAPSYRASPADRSPPSYPCSSTKAHCSTDAATKRKDLKQQRVGWDRNYTRGVFNLCQGLPRC